MYISLSLSSVERDKTTGHRDRGSDDQGRDKVPIYICIYVYNTLYINMNIKYIMCMCITSRYIDIHTYIHMNIHAYIHACIHTYMHTYIHIHIHIYRCGSSPARSDVHSQGGKEKKEPDSGSPSARSSASTSNKRAGGGGVTLWGRGGGTVAPVGRLPEAA